MPGSSDPTVLAWPVPQRGRAWEPAIGAYKLLQRNRRGGMGVVYLAEQEKPVRRRVALKIIKPGMDTKQVVARFEAERQALALMDHPNIARVLDGGATEIGPALLRHGVGQGRADHRVLRPHQLPVRERLELFIPVCQAIQHAHQKGIIHRDIKPSNILVTLTTASPCPRSSTLAWPKRSTSG